MLAATSVRSLLRQRKSTSASEERRRWISRWHVGDGAKIDSVAGLQLTINAILMLWQCLRGILRFMCTRRLNQDCVENLFCSIRQVNGANDQPNPTQFRHAYRKISMNTMLKPTGGANCEPDADAMLAVMTSSAARPDRPMASASVRCTMGGVTVPTGADRANGVAENVLAYIAGYLVRQEELRHECSVPLALLLRSQKAGRSVAAGRLCWA